MSGTGEVQGRRPRWEINVGFIEGKTLIASALHLHTPSRNTGAIFLLRGFVTISWTTNAS